MRNTVLPQKSGSSPGPPQDARMQGGGPVGAPRNPPLAVVDQRLPELGGWRRWQTTTVGCDRAQYAALVLAQGVGLVHPRGRLAARRNLPRSVQSHPGCPAFATAP